MRVFTLKIQVTGEEQEAVADRHERAIAVVTSEGTSLAHGVHAATRLAAGVLGPLLEQANRNDAPWGLYVDVAGNQAVYGDWPLLSGPPVDLRRKPSQLSKIRALWRDGDGPVAALNNAIKIIEEFAERGRMAA